MSMIGNLRRVTDDEIARLLANPETISDFLYGGVGGVEAANLEIDKAWHGIHYLLTGSAWEGEEPLNFLVAGGVPVGQEDVGYGPARAFESAQVRAIAAALDGLTADDLLARYDGARMTAEGIYPSTWDRADEADTNREYLAAYYQQVKHLIETLARDGSGMLVFLN